MDKLDKLVAIRPPQCILWEVLRDEERISNCVRAYEVHAVCVTPHAVVVHLEILLARATTHIDICVVVIFPYIVQHFRLILGLLIHLLRPIRQHRENNQTNYQKQAK